MTASLFGKLVGASSLEAALLEQLRAWLPDYLAEVERQHGLDVPTLARPRSFVITSEVERMPEDQTPTIIVRSPGTSDPPLADGRGAYAARFNVDVGVHLSARGGPNALRLARQYALALRALCVQQQTLDHIDDALDVRRVDWLGERYDELDSVDDRTVCTGVVVFAYELADVTTRGAGPLKPSIDPGPDSPTWPVSDTVEVTATKEPIA